MKINKNLSKILIILVMSFLIIIISSKISNNEKKELPVPIITEGERGLLGIDKNINESTIDQYLNRDDSVYIDLRMLIDPANYEAIGGNSKLTGYVNGFIVFPLAFIAPIINLPKEVGNTYSDKTLFSIDENGNYIPNYEESFEILEYFFPKDKYIFLMCGGGGYAGMTKNILVSLGWNQNKIYNVGGYWYYEGNNNILIENNNKYDFWKVPYYNIDFDNLTEVNNEK